MKAHATKWLLAAVLFFLNTGANAEGARRRETMDFGWRFMLGDPAGAQAAAYDDSGWQAVDLPHDWSIHLDFDKTATSGVPGGFLPAGIGWYRRTFRVPDSDRGRLVSVEFDGIREYGEVWINGHSLGRRPYGYTSVVYDMTPYLKFGGEDNLLAVRADNSRQPNSRWYAGSGIYRHTWLIVADALHIPQWGTNATTPRVSADSATVSLAVSVENSGAAAAQFAVVSSLIDRDGQEVGGARGAGSLDAGAHGEFTQEIVVGKPNLWSVEEPYLYLVRTTLREGEKVVDQYDTPIGIRSISWDADRGFILNGTPVKLNGVCVHADGGLVGVAVPEGVWVRRLSELKEMGCNAIRTAHNPPDPDFLDLCDRMGFCVMDEMYDEWQIPKQQSPQGCHLFFDEWHVRDTTDFVRRDRNHPCIVIWSAGNEISEQVTPGGAAVLQGLVDIFHREDPTRPVTCACDKVYAEPDSATAGFMALQDVAGYNYVDRWRDRANTYYSVDRRLFPERKFVGTESVSMGGTRGDYGILFPPAPAAAAPAPSQPRGATFWANWRSCLPKINVEQLLRFVRTYDYVAGDFMWTGIDYLGEGGVGTPSGVLDTCGFRKDGYYFYQSQWTSRPMVHLLPHWNWKGNEGRPLTVHAYSNCDTVELFLNGRSMGVRAYEFPRKGVEGEWNNLPARARGPHTTGDLHLSWDLIYEPGTLKAVGRRDGQVAAVEEIATTGEPTAVRLTVGRTAAAADGRDVIHAVVDIVDAEGRTVPTAANDVTFDVRGEARIIGVDNGSISISESFRGGERHAFNGRCLAILQTTRHPGAIQVTARSPGLREATVDLSSAE
ncbi:MAG TPA: glycoside hydrolase family 2 TIM barrel-domain containing protein [Opitutaceae bacterium]|nr:glycoside hydrolase family 2 TIM barrel-domain containing protein [Opitutaceae bacterium]